MALSAMGSPLGYIPFCTRRYSLRNCPITVRAAGMSALSVSNPQRENHARCVKSTTYSVLVFSASGLLSGSWERVRLCTLKGAIDNVVRSYQRQIHGFKSELGISATGGLSGMHDMNLAASSAFVGRVLLVSDDAIAVEELSESMQRFALSVEHCTEVSSALEQLKRSKFEAVIVDFRLGRHAGTVLQETRQSASNEHAVLFTVSDNQAETTDAFKAGSTFVLLRPLSAASIDLSLKAAYGLIVRERRRYFRCPVQVPVAILRAAMQTVSGHTVNVSEGGMSIITVA